MKSLLFYIVLILIITGCTVANAQTASIKGVVTEGYNTVAFANIYIKGTTRGTSSDENGNYTIFNLSEGNHVLLASVIGYLPYRKAFKITNGEEKIISIKLEASAQILDEMVVTGTLKPVSRLESPVPVEVYKPSFFKKNPTASIFEALQNVNGVRPQINCNVCNTGDIHINGLEGPYTLVLIDGMPIVSGLGTVYGLSGIPNSLIEQIEIVKGPASTLYGSEAVEVLLTSSLKTH